MPSLKEGKKFVTQLATASKHREGKEERSLLNVEKKFVSTNLHKEVCATASTKKRKIKSSSRINYCLNTLLSQKNKQLSTGDQTTVKQSQAIQGKVLMSEGRHVD